MKTLMIDNWDSHHTLVMQAERFEMIGDMVVGYDAEYYGKVVSYVKIKDSQAVQIRNSSPDEELYHKIADLDEKDMDALRNFLETSGIIRGK